MQAQLEHLNITVPDPKATAAMLAQVFGWQIRWEGVVRGDGYSIHIGSDHSYVALYRPGEAVDPAPDSHGVSGGLNHLGVVVDDVDAVEERVKSLGYEPHSHGDYEPGRRFYFEDEAGLEIEVVQY
jgi:catechol 2,3-dioxygenase-like lactoylglutathione lyase family enzyme